MPPAIRDTRLFWLAELAVLPLAVTFLAALPVALLDLAKGDVWFDRVEQVKGVILALVFAYLAERALTLFVWRGILRRHLDTLPSIVRSLVAFFIYLGAVYAILAYVFEQPVTGLLVSSGIALGVLGLAFQSTLTDIITGISLAIERPFVVGDWIELEGDIRGRVETIDWRATRLRTVANTTHVLPNHRIADTPIHNLSRPGPTYCFRIDVSVSGEIPPWEIRRLLLEAAIAAPEIDETPPPLVRIAEADRRPIQYAAFVHCASYDAHYAAKESFLLHAWQFLQDAGAEIAVDTQQIELRRARDIAFHQPTDAEFLGNVELLSPLKARERKNLLSAGLVRDLPAGAEIVRYGAEGQSFFVVLSGMVRIFRPSEEDGGFDVELARLGAGSYFGEMSLLTGESRSASISAHTRTRILEIPKSAMAPILELRPKLAKKLARIMAERKLATEGALRESDGKSFADRLNETTRDLLRRMQKFFRE